MKFSFNEIHYEIIFEVKIKIKIITNFKPEN